jgi:LPS-assembly protein
VTGVDATRRLLGMVAGMGILLFVICLPAICRADGVVITADSMEYIKEEQKYVATGNVRIVKDSAVVKADSAIYFDETADAELTGHVSIEDKDYLINTEQAEFNLDDNTGTLHNAIIFFKRDKVWINGTTMKKIGENHYYAKTAFFTSCDTEAYRTAKVLTSEQVPFSQKPDWCFKGTDADIVVGDTMSAKNVTYRVKKMPVFYWPYFWTGVGSNRQTGFEVPGVGHSSDKGYRYSQSFFWAIDENKDATFNMDYYTKRGIGTGVEYRFLDFNHKGTWYAYHIRDSKLQKDFFEVKVNDRYATDDIQAFLDVNYINHLEYYKEYPKDFIANISRFMQSSGEVSLPLNNSRAYFLNQYWINLREGFTEHVPQKLPELGYIVNPTAVGSAIFTLSASATNFYRNEEPHGQRMDIQPTLSYSFGDAVRLTQAISLRETAYNLTDGGSFGSSPHRELFQYRAQAQMRFLRNYGPFMHIIEPSLEYSFIPSAKILPLFDSTELPAKTSLLTLSLFNRFMFNGLNVSLRLSQPYDFHGGNPNPAESNVDSEIAGATTVKSDTHSLLPTRLDGAVSGPALPVNFTFDVAYDITNGRMDNVNSAIGFKVFRDLTLNIGERYSRIDDLMLYSLGISTPLGKHWVFNANTGYDAKGPGLRDFTIKTTYKEQCWNIDFVTSRRPSDGIRPVAYSYFIVVELKGIGLLRL